ncbi:type 1 glutamine amidotransferase [Candidatus Chloroploca asiatica]|uniref:Lipid II isoglutaminyl synthase (glutamine-hydrolyzing) subunit GatD n=1 Tax=Candidatus Chloroploca asiatica TaxID=1506545 RepID=A0A2H3KLZ1_9CHLR|nr:glutamine amidotransferase [Candidatus Chloroploca asiatica]PDV99031.1 glutamine amidotransferase [Candidatus Chloroploca asiatica]
MTYCLHLAHCYPSHMSIYGDRGNVIALVQRCAWRGIALDVTPIEPGDAVDWSSFDLAFFGGGQDSGQALIVQDLFERQRVGFCAAIEADLVLLAICGGYQLLGNYFLTHTGERLPGLGILDLHTVGGKQRLIGNVVVEATFGHGPPVHLVGFENHSGRTYHGPGVRSLGRVVVGHGDNGEDGVGGSVYRNTYGCYLHGSLLPKNPQLTDHLIRLALQRRYGSEAKLPPLEARLEMHAQQTMLKRLLPRRLFRRS